MQLQGSLCCCCWLWGDGEGVTPARTQRWLLGELGREEGEAPGEGARRDARCTTGAPAAGPGEPQTLDALVDACPVPASLSWGTTGEQGAAARSQHPPAPASAGKDASPTSLAVVSTRAFPGGAAGRERTGTAAALCRPPCPRCGGAGGRGAHMMVQEDSGFRMWQVQAAPQYWRKVW